MTREEFIEKAKELATDFWTMNLRDGTYESKFTELLDEYEGVYEAQIKPQKYSMKQILEQIINRNTEGNYLLSSTDKVQMVSEILDLVSVTDSLLADFLKYAIDDTMRISGDHDGLAGTIFAGDTYEKIAGDYISICNDR